MNYSELCAEVYTLTGRPDLVAETGSAVKSATLKCHQSDFYPKDLIESVLRFSAASFVQNFDYRSVLPRWRALKYLRKYDNDTGTPSKELKIILPDNIFDSYEVQKQDVCYLAGAYIQINSSTEQQYYLLGAYLNPDITTAGYNSWVALDHPYAIVFDAVATVFKSIGKDEEAAANRGLVAEQISMLKASNLIAEGF